MCPNDAHTRRHHPPRRHVTEPLVAFIRVDRALSRSEPLANLGSHLSITLSHLLSIAKLPLACPEGCLGASPIKKVNNTA